MIGPLMPAPNMDYRIDYMATVQSRHCIVIGDNQIFCLQRSDEWVEILDKDIQNSNCHACFKWGLPCQTHSLCLLKSREGSVSFGINPIKFAWAAFQRKRTFQVWWTCRRVAVLSWFPSRRVPGQTQSLRLCWQLSPATAGHPKKLEPVHIPASPPPPRGFPRCCGGGRKHSSRLPCLFVCGRITELNPTCRSVAFGTGTAERQPSRGASHSRLNGRGAGRRQTALPLTYTV